MVQNLAKINFKQIDNSIAEDVFLFVSEVFATRSSLHRTINIEIDLYRDYLKAGYHRRLIRACLLSQWTRVNRKFTGC